MAWLVLVVSGILEAVWAIALDKANGFTNLLPSLVFVAALIASMLRLSYAVKTLPIGTAYAVWVGIGASLAVIYSMTTGAEPASAIKITLISVLMCCVLGLKIVSDHP